jgi:hypothetical protein
VPLTHGGVQLAIPLRISYEGLDAHLQALLAGRPLTLQVPGRGQGTIAVDKLNIYPSGDRIAVGVHVNATMPDSYFNTRGWLYWTARPLLAGDGKAVNLGEIGSSKLAGHPLAGMLQELVDKHMQQGLAAAGQFDLTDSLTQTVERVKSGFAAQGGKLPIDMSNATIRLGHVVLGQDALFIEALFTAGEGTPAGGNGA